jgi:thiosulfate dehydrogenase [quinone] large subunit
MAATTNTPITEKVLYAPAAPATEAGEVRARPLWGLLRLSMGWIFLWAFLDKVFGWGRATAAGKGWLDGGSPTAGFLGHAATGPFKGLYGDIAGAGWADWLFMLGLLGVGGALVLGVAMRIASASGALLLVLMWTAVLPPATNPFMDDHLVYALLLGVLCLTGAGRTLGLGRRWEQLALVRRYPALA